MLSLMKLKLFLKKSKETIAISIIGIIIKATSKRFQINLITFSTSAPPQSKPVNKKYIITPPKFYTIFNITTSKFNIPYLSFKISYLVRISLACFLYYNMSEPLSAT